MLAGLNQLTFAVSDVSRSFDFYVNILGFTPKVKWKTGAYLSLIDKGSLGDLWLCLSFDKVADKGDYTHYAFTVSSEEIGAFLEKLRSAKIIEWKENRSEGESIYFLDPDGHRLEIHCGSLESRLQSCRENPYEGMIFY